MMIIIVIIIMIILKIKGVMCVHTCILFTVNYETKNNFTFHHFVHTFLP